MISHKKRDEKKWSERYGKRHRLRRVTRFPRGVARPRKVRLYARRDHYVLQWWDRAEKRTLSERVEGDLVAAIARARQIDERLESFKSSGHKSGRLGHADLVERYRVDLQQRADAGEIDVATVQRYSSALSRQYLVFVTQPHIAREYRQAASIDRGFQRSFAAYLAQVQVSPNGHPNSARRSLKNPAFIMDVVRAMFEWAADPERGNSLPDGFRNPFAQRLRSTHRTAGDLLSTPDVTVPMAVDLLGHCDRFQLGVFAPLLLFGLRPGELGWLFHEDVTGGWLRVGCHPELDYLTKGRRDKGFPVPGALQNLWGTDETPRRGLIHTNRQSAETERKPPLAGFSRATMVQEYRDRCASAKQIGAQQRRRIRDDLLKEAGQLRYDQIQAEFRKLVQLLDWPAAATLKDLRHLFATSLEAAGVPELVRRYLMGHSLGRGALMAYTHISQDHVREHYDSSVETELAPIVVASQRRHAELSAQVSL